MNYFRLRAHFIAFIALASVSTTSLAANILAVVSPRNTPDVLSGAHQFLNNTENHQIVLRTTDQFVSLDEAARNSLMQNADIVFLGGVYGLSLIHI